MDGSASNSSRASWRRADKPQTNGARPVTAPPHPVKRGGGASEGGEPQEPKKRVRRGGRRKQSSAGNGAATKEGEDGKAATEDWEIVDVDAVPADGKEAAARPAPSTMDHLSDVLFSSLDISDKTKRAIVEDLKYERLTHVQNETFAHILDRKDVLAKAKTGNGKTIAFLLPVIENLVRDGRPANAIPVLVISPTRELALQIATEARRVSKFHKLNISCFVGGSSISKDTKTLTSSVPLDILIATPGRLQDHLGQDTGGIQSKLGKARVLILDEADRLLDMGFRPEIMRIIGYLPKNRQTLLFSATLPASTEELKRVALRDDYEFVDTIDEDDQQTNVQTVQEFISCPMEDVIPVVESVLSDHMKQSAYKVMVFFPTARAAQFMAQLFVAAGFPNVLEIHSRKSQGHRTKTAEAFRTGKKVILFSSDVSARGVDYPDVSLVLQVGLTDRDQYIHRLGRTARAGMQGRGVLVLADFEKQLLKELSDLPMTQATPVALSGPSRTVRVMENLSSNKELEKSAQQSYQAWLGFYNTHMKRLHLDRVALVQLAAQYSAQIGLREVPKLEKRTLKKMNLFGVPGIEPSAYEPRGNNGGGGGGRGGGGRGGGGRSFGRR